MILKSQKSDNNQKIFFNLTKNFKHTELQCPFCDYHSKKTFNYERHIVLHHNIECNKIQNIPKSIFEQKGKLNKKRKRNIKINKFSISSGEKLTIFSEQNLLIPEKNEYLQLLLTVFDKKNRLNKFEMDIGSYYFNHSKIIGKGHYSETHLGEDKKLKLNVAILKTELSDRENLDIEKYILQRVHGKGNFPQLYEILIDDNFEYFIESLMGPNLKALFKICNKHFDYITIINIGIDIISNLKILHDLGFVHRDLKPDNLVFGNLSYENFKWKSQIGLIDFGNSGIILNKYGSIEYSKKSENCMGNSYFASINTLKGKDCTKLDDIISVFYILIYFYLGALPWGGKNNGKKYTKQEILEIKEKTEIKDLCYDLPENFIYLTEKILNAPREDEPNYQYILEYFNSLKSEEALKTMKTKNKFSWITLLDDFISNPSKLSKTKKNEIKSLFNKYCLNIKEYLKYIKLE